jgi:REP element-mobilizing transposase RayT
MHDDLGASDDMAYGQLGLRFRLPTLWSRSYYAGSVGAVSEAAVRLYIEAQKGA